MRAARPNRPSTRRTAAASRLGLTVAAGGMVLLWAGLGAGDASAQAERQPLEGVARAADTAADTAAADTAADTTADFDPNVEAWNSLHYLPITAHEAKVDLEALDVLDWARITPDDILIVIAPDRASLAPDLRAFVEDGGGALLAVDVGTAPELTAALGAAVVTGPPENDRYFRDHPAFPALTPPPIPLAAPNAGAVAPAGSGWPFASAQDTLFLWYNVTELVLNHPVGLVAVTPAPPDTTVLPSVRFSSGNSAARMVDDAALVLEVRLGRGQALVVGDASLFIDDMQRNAYGDKQFAANAMRWFCGAGPCNAKLVSPKTRVVGTYAPRHGQRLFGLEGVLTKGLESVNDGVADVNTLAESESAQLAVGLGLVLLLTLACLRLPWPEAARRFLWQTAPGPTPPFEAYWASALACARGGADFSVAALGLASRLRRALSQVDSRVAARLPTEVADQVRLVASVRDALGPAAAEATSRSLTGLVRVHMGTVIDSDPVSPPFSLEELEALWTDTTLVEQALPPRRPS